MWVLYGFAVIAGVLNTVQAGANASLNKALQQPFVAALTVVGVSFTTLLLSGLVSGHLAWPGSDKVAGVPWWAWFGGLFGATYVMSQLLVAERVGAAVYIGLTVTAAVVTSVAFDHFGWLGFKAHPAHLGRLIGAGLMIAGVGLIAAF